MFSAAVARLDRQRAFIETCQNIDLVANAKINGKHQDASHVFRKELSDSLEQQASQRTKETLNATDASLAALELGARHDITADTFSQLHCKLLTGTTRASYQGQLRTDSAPVGGSRYHVFGEPYQVAEPERIPALLDELACFCNAQDVSPIARTALAHVFFHYIHPFKRANGKTARVVIPLVLSSTSLIEDVSPPITLAFAASPRDYQKGVMRLMRELNEGCLHIESVGHWLRYFSRCCSRSIRETERFWNETRKLEDAWLSRLNVRQDSATAALVAALSAIPVFTSAIATAHIGRSTKRTALAIEALLEAGVISLIGGSKRNRVFECASMTKLYSLIVGYR